MNGLHDGRKAAAEVVGGVGPDLRGLFENNDFGRAVEEPGQQLAQLHLQFCCQGGEETTVSGTAAVTDQMAEGCVAASSRAVTPLGESPSSAGNSPSAAGGDEQRLLTQSRRRTATSLGLAPSSGPAHPPTAPEGSSAAPARPSDSATSHRFPIQDAVLGRSEVTTCFKVTLKY